MGNDIITYEIKKPPHYHFNCRYDLDDLRCNGTAFYTRTNDIYVKNYKHLRESFKNV
jgi:hypothetical protein